MKTWMNDNKQVMKWLVAALARGIAFILVAWLGMSAKESGVTAQGIAEAVGALVVAGVSIYTSYKGRKTLKAEPPK